MKKLYLVVGCIFLAVVLIAQPSPENVKNDPDPEPEQLSRLNVYPNPADDHVFVEFTLARSNTVNITIANHIGQLKLQKELKIEDAGSVKEKLDISKLQAGIYFIKLSCDPTNQHTKRFVIK